jgi:hypothetical protein
MLKRCTIKGENFEERLYGVQMTVFPRTFFGLIISQTVTLDL